LLVRIESRWKVLNNVKGISLWVFDGRPALGWKVVVSQLRLKSCVIVEGLKSFGGIDRVKLLPWKARSVVTENVVTSTSRETGSVNTLLLGINKSLLLSIEGDGE